MQRKDFQRLTTLRLAEVGHLLKAKQYSGAFYLTGLAIECALKACIARRTRRGEFPSRERTRQAFSHDYGELIDAAALRPSLKRELAADRDFARYWTAARVWRVQSRYEVHTRAKALDLHKAVTDPHHGVLQWLRRIW